MSAEDAENGIEEEDEDFDEEEEEEDEGHSKRPSKRGKRSAASYYLDDIAEVDEDEEDEDEGGEDLGMSPLTIQLIHLSNSNIRHHCW